MKNKKQEPFNQIDVLIDEERQFASQIIPERILQARLKKKLEKEREKAKKELEKEREKLKKEQEIERERIKREAEKERERKKKS